MNVVCNLTTNVQVWNGKEAQNPPHLEAFINLLTTILNASANISFALEIEGNQISVGNIHSPKSLKSIEDIISLALYVKRAKNVLKYIGKTMKIDFSAGFSANDHRTLARISDIVEGKLRHERSQIIDWPEMTILCKDKGKTMMNIINREDFSALRIEEPTSFVTIYGKICEIPPTTTFYAPVKLHILSRKPRRNASEYRIKMEMADNFKSQTFFALDATGGADSIV